MTSSDAADGSAGEAAADRLGQADQVGGDPEPLDRAAVGDGGAGLDLVEGEQRALGVQQLLDARQVAVLGQDEAGVHHRRLDDHAGDAAPVAGERALERLEVVERHHPRERDHLVGDPERLRHRHRVVVRPDLVGRRRDRHHHGVAMAVVGALDLEQDVAALDGPHQADGVHGGLGARVAEPPQRQAEALLQVLADDHGVLGRLGEVGAAADAIGDDLGDLGMRMADGHRAVAVVEVDVLVPVLVGDLRAVPLHQIDRVRVGRLPARGDTACERLAGAVGQLARAVLAGVELGLLDLDQLREPGGVNRLLCNVHAFTPPSTSP